MQNRTLGTIVRSAVACGLLGIAALAGAQTVKIGLIMTYSGQFADPAAQLDNGIKLYVKQHGDLVAGKKELQKKKDSK